MAGTVTVTADNWDTVVNNATVPVLVDFWAPWCAPCKQLAPTLDELAAEFGDDAIIAKVNIDEERSLAAKWQIMSIPSLLFFNQGEKTEEIVGAAKKSRIANQLRDLGHAG